MNKSESQSRGDLNGFNISIRNVVSIGTKKLKSNAMTVGTLYLWTDSLTPETNV